MDLAFGRRHLPYLSLYNIPDNSPDPPFLWVGDEANASYNAGLPQHSISIVIGLRARETNPIFGRRQRRIMIKLRRCRQVRSVWASLINGVLPSFIEAQMEWLIRVCRQAVTRSCGPSDPKEATVSKKLFEMKSKVKAIRNSLQWIQDTSGCEDVIKFIEEELRCLKAEYRWKLYVQALIAWIAELIVGNGDCDSLQTLSVSLLAAQTIEIVLVASGDVERNPGPTYLDGMF